MNESIGGSGMFNILIIIVSALLLLLMGFIAFSKAFKVKNHIINFIHENRGDIEQSFDDIENDLRSVGYSSSKMKECDDTDAYRDLNEKMEVQNAILEIQNPHGDKDSVTIVVNSDEYPTPHDYCIYKYTMSDGSYYYTVLTYVHMNIPLVEKPMHVEVKGETKTFNRKYDD